MRALQHPPILLITDVMCRLAPIIEKRRPGLLENGGALPRIGAPNEDDIRRVDIPSLAIRGTHMLPDPEERGEPSTESASAQEENVYTVFRDAEPAPGVQRGVDFGLLLKFCSEEERWGAAGSALAELARSELGALNRNSRYSLGLFEVVAVLHHHAVARRAEVRSARDARSSGAVDGGCGDGDGKENGASLGAPASLRDLEERLKFSTSVLATAVGSRNGEVPALPGFSEGTHHHPETRKVLSPEGCIAAYAEVKGR